MAAAYGVDVGSSPAVVVDIGGGSVEVTLGTANHLTLGKSFKARRHPADRALRQDRPAREARRAAAGEVHQPGDGRATSIRWRQRGFDRLIGTSGTILSLGTMAVADASASAPEDMRNRRVPAKALRRLRKRLVGSGHRRTACASRAWTRAAPTCQSAGSRALRHDRPPARRRRVHAVRPGAARRAGARLHPPQQRPHPQGRALSGRPPPQRRSSSASGAATGRSTRSRSRGSR